MPIILLMLIHLWIGMEWPSSVEATAPARTSAWCTGIGQSCPGGRPYAEAALCATSAVILCEDFNYSAHIVYDGVGQGSCCQWYNPGLEVNNYGFKQWASLWTALITDYTTSGKAGGEMPSGSDPDRVLVNNWDAVAGTAGGGNLWGTLRTGTNGYQSGHTTAQAQTFYIRWQQYMTSDFVWSGGSSRSNNVSYQGTAQCYDTKFLYFWPSGAEDNPTGAHYDSGLHVQCGVADTSGSGQGGQNITFADAVAMRYGNIGFPAPMECPSPYKFLPLCSECQNFCGGVGGYDTRFNFQSGYAPFQNTATLIDPNETPTAGKVFRMNRAKWYTFEIKYVLPSADDVADGAVAVWVDGVKIYDEGSLYTCGAGLVGACTPIGELYIGAYHNQNDGPPNNPDWDGQMIIDNLVISTAPIGAPDSGGLSQTSPLFHVLPWLTWVHVTGLAWLFRSVLYRIGTTAVRTTVLTLAVLAGLSLTVVRLIRFIAYVTASHVLRMLLHAPREPIRIRDARYHD